MVRITIPRLLTVALCAALVAYVFAYGPRLRTSAGAASPAATLAPPAKAKPAAPPEFPPQGKKFIGIMNGEGPYNFSALDSFTHAVGHQPEVYEFSQGWALNQFNPGIIEQVADRGMLPMISWEPWNYHKEPKVDAQRGYQPAYSLSNIIDGKYDSYIRSWAEGVKSLGFTIAIRFAHEMNGYWYPWAIFANGNKTYQYVQAWRHVHDIFTQVGAKNVIWVWSPNIIWNNFSDLAKLYPGNSYVNWIGLSGYYGTPGMGDYQTFNSIFDRTIKELRTFTDKPLVITETAATDVSGQMARWITAMFKELPAQAGIIGVIWYEDFNVVDWKVTDDPAAVAAFRKGFASGLYRIAWSRDMVPELKVPIPGAGGSTGKPSGRPSKSSSRSPSRSPSPTPTS
jgi:mannan endo-1,4-beta-mannosidase